MDCSAPTSQAFQDRWLNRLARNSMCGVVLPSDQLKSALLGQHMLCVPGQDQPGLLQVGMDLLRVACHVHRGVEDIAECAGTDSLSGISRLLGLPCCTRRALVA